MNDIRKIKYWRGRKVKHLDAIAHLRFERYSLFQIRDAVKKSLENGTDIQVNKLSDISAFLSTCEYKSDQELFGVKDYWQTPIEFESLRSGDCEDFALWTWSKLIKLGKDARMTLGSNGYSGHAWVTIFHNHEPFIYETTLKLKEGKIPIVSVLKFDLYKPSISIDSKLNFFQHPN